MQRAYIAEAKQNVTAGMAQRVLKPFHATGYGKDIPTSYMVRLEGYGNRWRRVYSVCYSNSGSVYCKVAGEWVFFENDWVLQG